MFVGASFVFLLRSVDRERSSARLAVHSEQVLAAADRLERLVLELESGQRSFSVSGDQRSLALWQAARGAIPATGATFLRLTEVPAHHVRAQELVTAVNSYVTDYSAPLVSAARSTGAAGHRSPAAAKVTPREDRIRAQFDRFRVTEQGFVAGRQQQAAHDATQAKTAATIGLAGSLALILLYAGYMTRAIVLPIRRGAAMAHRLAEGDLSTRMPETGAGELGELEHAFNTMGQSLETSRDELRMLAEEQAAQLRVATLVARNAPAQELLEAVVEEVDRVLGASSTRMARYMPDDTVVIVVSSSPASALPVGASWPTDGEHLAGEVYRTGRPARRDSLEGLSSELGDRLREDGIRSAVATPIVVGGQLWGMLVAYWTDIVPGPDTEDRMEHFTDLVATAIANAASRAELRASRARVVATADETRRRIERDLHDGAQQRLVHTVMTLKLARQALEDAPEPGKELIDEALSHAEGATAELRELVHGILPASLGRGGLRAGVDSLVSRVPLQVSMDVTSERLPPILEATGYFVVAEALTNVVKHARASHAEVRAFIRDGELHVEVQDDGVGGAEMDGNLGLLGLHDRVTALDGVLTVVSPVDGGTAVSAVVPIPGLEDPS